MTLRLAPSFVLPTGMLLGSLLAGCLPLPESVGDGLSTATDTGSTGDDPTAGVPTTADDGSSSDGSTGEPHVGPEPLWELVLEFETSCWDVQPMPDGGVVVLVNDFTAEPFGYSLRRYAPDGSLVWKLPTQTETFAMAALPDGRIVVGGGSGDPMHGVLQLLSADGELQAQHDLPPPAEPADRSMVLKLDASATGVAVLVYDTTAGENDRYRLARAGLDLEPQWWEGFADFADEPIPYNVWDMQLAASGSVRTIVSGIGGVHLRSHSPSGTLESDEVVDTNNMLFAGGDPGVVLQSVDESGERFVRLRGLEERPGLDVLLSEDELGLSFSSSTLYSHHYEGMLLLGTATESHSTPWVSLRDMNGDAVYQQTLDSSVGPSIFVFGVAPGPDDSIYMCGSQSDVEAGQWGFLIRRFPQW